MSAGRAASFVALCLVLMTWGWVRAASPVPVWIALAESSTAHVEAAEALRAEVDRALPGRVEWRIATWTQFAASDREPAIVVAVGAAAYRGMLELAWRDSPPPLLAILVPRTTFERAADPARLRAGTQSAVFIDQPLGRHLDLIRLAMPDARRVGVLFGAESGAQIAALDRAARDKGLRIVGAEAESGRLYPALRQVLDEADILLALPDPAVFNNQTAGNILTAAYRRHVPLAGFSPSWAKAGALFALYSTPAQVGARGAEAVRAALAGRPLPPPQSPREFVVAVNADVARSLGLVLDERDLAEQMRQRERP